jgi:hypothetical protein
MTLIACSSPVDVADSDDLTPVAPRVLHITPTKGVWTWDEVAGPEGSGLRASLTNATEQSYLSTLGDKFNAATEQAFLFVAKGGSAALEWRDVGGEWKPVALAQLVEGVKPVLLRRGGHYTLSALLFGPRRTGLYRIRVDYFEPADESMRYSDYSPPFEIR